MRHTGLVMAAAMAAALGACVVTEENSGNEPAVVSANPDQVTVRFQEGDLDDATRTAQQVCANYMRSAQFRSVTPGQGNERIGVYACR